ncbi:MAG: Zn-dependent protease with chaperone function [Pseudoalteromonas tetraodonis]|jgi:Zn-dependent protease with chaperone function
MEQAELSAADITRALEGKELPKRRFRPLYFLALMVTAAAVMAIVLAYFGVVAGLGYGILRYASHWLETFERLSSPDVEGAKIGKWLFLAIILFLPTMLMVIMLKPLIVPRAPEAEFRFKIELGRHPAFDALVSCIAKKMGLSPPTRVIVTNEVNAYASFGSGFRAFFGNRIELMIGLPLVACMNVSQIGGVIAHEYGHFSQRIGMRISYLILCLTAWLNRMAYSYDRWDLWILSKSNPERGLDLPRIFFWISNLYRFVLKCAARLAGAISAATCQQMEHDADISSIDFSGSDDFARASIRISEASCAFRVALANCRAFWVDRRLPENFPGFVAATLEDFPPEAIAEIEEVTLAKKSAWYDSYPSDTARIAKAKRRGAEGIFHVNEPATCLFDDFERLAQHVTHNYYDIDLDLHVHHENLVENSQFIQEKKQRASERKLSDRFYGDGASVYLPVAMNPARFASPVTTAELWQLLDSLKYGLSEAIESQKQLTTNFVEKHVARSVSLWQAMIYTQSKIQIDASSFGLERVTVGTIENAREEADRQTRCGLEAMGENEQLYADLFRTVLNLLGRDEVRPLETAALRADFEDGWMMNQALWGFRKAAYALRELRSQIEACGYVLDFVFTQDESDAAVACGADAARQVAARLEQCRGRVLGFFTNFPYPFAHAEGKLSIEQFASLRDSPPEDFDPANQFHLARFEMSRTEFTLEHLTTLYFRLLERMASLCEGLEELKPAVRTGTVTENELALLS